MTDYTPYQKRVIKRYYNHRDHLMIQKLGEIASELYTADEKKAARLWQRAAQALRNLEVPEPRVQTLLESKSPERLARLIAELF